MRVVKSMDEMDPDTVLKHCNRSHLPLGSMNFLAKSRVPNDQNEDLLRRWHEFIHSTGEQNGKPLTHTHGRSTTA